MSGHGLDIMARRIFTKALDEDRCGELLECLFENGSATVDPNGKLVLIPARLIEQAVKS